MKIDRSFILRMEKDPAGLEFVNLILLLARNLNLTAIAEGVETAEALQSLGRMNCRFAQGYYFSRPLPPDEAEVLLGNRSAFA